MLSTLILESLLPESRQALVTPESLTTWAALRAMTQSIVSSQATLACRRVGLVLKPDAASYAALAALERLHCDIFLLDHRLTAEACHQLAVKFRLGALLFGNATTNGDICKVHQLDDEESWSGGGTITILTSGSTGQPKAARHSWESISRPLRKARENLAPRWLLTYSPNLYAGLQVMLQCFSDRGTLIVPNTQMEPQAIAKFMLEHNVEFVSATPSYLRRLLMFSDQEVLRRVPIRQITLGGEIADQFILEKLRNCYPQGRIVHIYATTELGRCFSVTDGSAGFPAGYLETTLPDGAALKVVDGELLIRSLNGMQMYDPLSLQARTLDEWFPTGDLVQIRDGRVYFVGRKSEMINVAGSKVYPVEVEKVIRSIPGVSDVRVFGKSSSIAGELVACEIVPKPEQDQGALKEDIIRACRAALSSYQQPRLIKFVDQIDVSSAGKTLRTKA